MHRKRGLDDSSLQPANQEAGGAHQTWLCTYTNHPSQEMRFSPSTFNTINSKTVSRHDSHISPLFPTIDDLSGMTIGQGSIYDPIGPIVRKVAGWVLGQISTTASLTTWKKSNKSFQIMPYEPSYNFVLKKVPEYNWDLITTLENSYNLVWLKINEISIRKVKI